MLQSNIPLQSSGVFDPRGSRQISAQVRLPGSLPAEIKSFAADKAAQEGI